MPSLIIHGHFYQPPRENPWTGIVEAEPSAAPFHDWNERIHFECYQPNAFARIANPKTGSELIVNNYSRISFNFGPTLLTWLERYHADTYARIIDADRGSGNERRGHGDAIAQAYGHAILPLCNARDLRTQIRWGIADFRYRFGRNPEALWLPETACNDFVLAALIDEGLPFLILAPHQAASVRAIGETSWRNVNEQSIDTSIPYRYSHPDGSGQTIVVFFYDGLLSRAIAFENLLKSSHDLVDRLAESARGAGELVNVATDGETYGHHFKFGDICLANALEVDAVQRGLKITNYGEYLNQNPPASEVRIDNGAGGEGTSWSCPHGTARWIRDCGCHTGGEPAWNQAWRTPLRTGLDFLRDENAGHFEATRGELFEDPWQARDDSIALILNQYYSREQFLYEHAARSLFAEDQWRALAFLEAQRMALLMYTSCGWFFNDISGIETIQVLKYAGRAIDLMGQLGLPPVRDQFLEILAEARSNKPEIGNGADIYRRFVEPLRPGHGSARGGERTAEARA